MNDTNKPPRYWKPLSKVPKQTMNPHSETVILHTMKEYNCTREEAISKLDAEDRNVEYYVNNLYQVMVEELGNNLVHINIRRRDGSVDLRDWRHFQQIKNEILGPECEAIEVYPAESRKVDTSNKYHLWGVRDPTWRIPIGFTERDVQDNGYKDPGIKQRPF